MEEFKKELTREVLQMTEEVSKLQREKQNVEHKIADLFAFYAKQKQSRNEVSRNWRNIVRLTNSQHDTAPHSEQHASW